MIAVLDWFDDYLTELTAPLLLVVVSVLAGVATERLLAAVLGTWSRRTGSPVGSFVAKALGNTWLFWSLLVGVYLAVHAAPLLPEAVAIIETGLLILFVISLTLVSARLAAGLIRHYGEQIPGALPVTSLSQNLVRWLIFGVGALILLHVLGLTITPILTALGIGGLAVALALRDTLANIFAGFYIGLTRQVRPGDYIRLEGGQEGYVVDIAWRYTTIRTLANNWVILPNEKLAGAIVTNFSLPDRRMVLYIPFTVSAAADQGEVEKILLEEAGRGAQDIPGLLAQPEPQVRLASGVGKAVLDYQLVCHIADYAAQYAVQSELNRRVLRRLREAGIPTA